MKKTLPLSICILFTTNFLSAQNNSDSLFNRPEGSKEKKKVDLSSRTNDHFLLQLGYTKWAGMPDTINTKGLSKSINVYFMFDFPFKTNPKLSMAFGGGIGSDHMLFSRTYVGIKDNTSAIRFTNQSDTNHFKKTKLATAYFEVPVEFRFSADPMNGKGIKMALGVKVGLLLSAHTRNTKFENKANTVINDYVMKEASKRFMNKTRISGMARIGYGNFSLYGSYQFTPLFKDGSGPKVNPFSIGLTLSGL